MEWFISGCSDDGRVCDRAGPSRGRAEAEAAGIHVAAVFSSGSFGGGGGGSRSGGFSERGAASSGNWQADRSSMQSSRQSSAEQMRSSRQSNQRPNATPGRATASSSSKIDKTMDRTRRKADKLRTELAAKPENYASDYDNYHYSGSGGGYITMADRINRPPSNAGAFAARALTGAIIGSTLTAAASPRRQLPQPRSLWRRHLLSGGATWYQPVYQGSQVAYVVVNPPR